MNCSSTINGASRHHESEAPVVRLRPHVASVPLPAVNDSRLMTVGAANAASLPKLNRRSTWKFPTFSLLAVVTVVGLGTAGTLPRRQRETELQAQMAEAETTPPAVSVAIARSASGRVEQLLPGNSMPLFETAIAARTNGYLKRRLVDIGDRVAKGALLAEIATPEIDDQLEQSRATLAQSRANLVRDVANQEYADIELERDRTLLKRGEISHEEHDRQLAQTKVATANVHATEATIRLNEADVQRLTDLQSYETISAPFSGVITVRNYDAGALITADNPTAPPLFRLAQIDTLRVMVDVPQVYSTSITVGQTAIVFRREDPQRQFTGTVTRMATALDPNTRTMLTEVQVPNPDGALFPGMYLQVKFIFSTEQPRVIIPAAALVTRTEGTFVPVLDDQHVVHHVAVQIGRDFGAELEVIGGLKGGETVVVHPGDAFLDGTHVQPVSPGKQPAASSKEMAAGGKSRP
jgi:RND family efflux transporter MFP subunit